MEPSLCRPPAIDRRGDCDDAESKKRFDQHGLRFARRDVYGAVEGLVYNFFLIMVPVPL